MPLIQKHLWKIIGALTLLLAFGALLGLALRSAETTGKASARAEIAEKVVSEAVEERKAAVKADAQVASKNRVALDSARRSAAPAEEFHLKSKTEVQDAASTTDRAGSDAEWSRLFNDAIRGGNLAIESTRRLP